MEGHEPLFARGDDGEDMMLSRVAEKLASRGISPDEVAGALEREMPELIEQSGAILLGELKRNAPAMLEDRQAIRSRFVRRQLRKWGEPLRLLRTMVVMAREAGAESCMCRPAAAEQDLVLTSLVRLQARACLVAEEILCLMEGGFASGAHSRWRTLHELTTVAFFVSQHGQGVAERYLLHHVIETCKAAHQYQEHCHALGRDPLDDGELDRHREARVELCGRFGTAYREDWGWAAEALGQPRPRFADIERAVNLDHLRPYFRLSCHPTHAGSKGLVFDLGNSLNPEAEDMMLSGPSDAGISEPGICTALSLLQITAALLTLGEPTFSRLAVLGAMRQMSRETQEAFAFADAELGARAPRVRGRLERFRARDKAPPRSPGEPG